MRLGAAMRRRALTRATSFQRALRGQRCQCRFMVVLCLRCRVAVGEYDPHVSGSAANSARLVVAASSRLSALVADLRQVGASCGLGGAHEAAHVTNARVRHAEAHAESGTPSSLVGAKLGVARQAAVDAIAEAKCDATRHRILNCFHCAWLRCQLASPQLDSVDCTRA